MENIDIEIQRECGNFKLRVNGILIVDNKVLSVKMQKNEFFCLPGGHIELGEDSKEAIIREMKEETGYDIMINKLIALTENFFTRKNGKKIHEISLYYLLDSVNEIKIKNQEYSVIENDKGEIINHKFKWIEINHIDNENFKPVMVKEKIKNQDYKFEHIIIK